ncbi:lipase-like domain-containing protein [Butyrivibrio sp. LC3010]|uniref:lipase-like domain-containing protein n=1 Tax=Butyrivibrio sp. LC3010 TaxID=1280680 RepID=UPI003FA43BD6
MSGWGNYELRNEFIPYWGLTFTKADMDGRESWDYASFDMHIDNALELNRKITTFDDVFYLAYPCASTIIDENGEVNPDPDKTETIFMKGAIYMSKYTGTTAGGFYIDESWRANDGLVNEESAKAPIGSKSSLYEEGGTLTPGVWYVMPTFTGDHMSLQGGLTKRINVRPFYAQLAQILESLPEHADK